MPEADAILATRSGVKELRHSRYDVPRHGQLLAFGDRSIEFNRQVRRSDRGTRTGWLAAGAAKRVLTMSGAGEIRAITDFATDLI
jgi:hypothetical protein